MNELTPEQITQLLGPETIAKIYNDGLSNPTKEIGKTATEILKTFRLFLAPFQIGAVYQDRFEKYLEKVRESVPEENQIECSPRISGPIFEKLKYLEEENYLNKLYLNLLARAIDRERINEAHPAFVTVIDQLSPDEAIILNDLAKSKHNFSLHYYTDTVVEVGAIINEELIDNSLPLENLTFPENLELYIKHLNFLNLIELSQYRVGEIDESKENRPVKLYKIVHFSKFGKMFYEACVK